MNRTFVERIEARAALREETAAQSLKNMNYPYDAFDLLKRGEWEPSISEIENMAEYFGCTTGYLTGSYDLVTEKEINELLSDPGKTLLMKATAKMNRADVEAVLRIVENIDMENR